MKRESGRENSQRWKSYVAATENMFAHSTWNAANLYGGSLAALSKRDKGENFHVEKPPA